VISKTLSETTGTVTVQAPGWVEADPFAIYVPALAAGVVEEMLVLEGERVKAGQVVARLIEDDARLAREKAQAELAQQEAELKTAEAVLTAAQTDWENPIERDRAVAVNEALLQEKQALLLQLDAEITMHQSKWAELDDNYQRLKALQPEAASEQQFKQVGFQLEGQKAILEATEKKKETVEAQLKKAQAELVAAQKHRRLRIVERRTLDEAAARVDKTKAQVELARVVGAEAQLRLDRMQVRSPADGVVMTRRAVPGSKLMLDMEGEYSANVVHLYDPEKLQVRADVPLVDAAQVGIGQKAEIVVDVLPNKRFFGHITRIVHEADIEKNTLEVKVAIENPSDQLKPEMLARIKFIAQIQSQSGDATNRAFVPERLIKERSGNSGFVWLVTADGCAGKKSITLGVNQQDGWIEVIDGLNVNEPLIADPSESLEEGDRVRVIGERDF